MEETGLPQSGKGPGLSGVGGSSAKGILLVLFALAVCFGYFYFFTDIFRSKDEVAGQRDIISSEVRKPLPPRNAVTPQASVEGKSPAPAAPAAATGKPAAVATPPQPPAAQVNQQPEGKKPAAEVKAKAAPASGTSQEKTPAVKPKVVQKPAPAVKAPAKQPQAKVAAAKAAGKPSQPTLPAEKNSAVQAKPGATAGPAPATTANSRKTGTDAERSPAPAPAPTAVKKDGGAFTLVIGTYVLKSSMLGDKAKLERSGLKPVTVTSGKKAEPMNRLLVADFSTHAEAQAEMDRVKKANNDAFVLKENGRFVVYAGSYYTYERAMEEREQLNKKGIHPTITKSLAPVSTYTLTAGSFSTRESALEESARLKKLGLKPFVKSRK